MKEIVVLFVVLMTTNGSHSFAAKAHDNLLACNRSLAHAQFVVANDPDVVGAYIRCRKVKLEEIQHIPQYGNDI